MAAEQRKKLIEKIEAKRGSRLICCLTSDRQNAAGMIAKDFSYRFFRHLRAMPDTDNVDVFLFTYGGDTLASYSLSRLVRQFVKTFGVLVPHMCWSGGTLFALGADEIVMTQLATLSAIDPSITGPFNPMPSVPMAPGINPGQGAPVAVESISGFKKLVREEWHLNEEGTEQAFRMLADKVNPVLLGDLQRTKEQIIRLATTLMSLHNEAEDPEGISKVVEMLATGLGSHDYMICADEARFLKMPIADSNPALENLILRLYEDFAEEMELGIPYNPAAELLAAQEGHDPNQAPISVTKVLKVVMIESLQRQDVWEREVVLVPPGQMQIRRDHWRV